MKMIAEAMRTFEDLLRENDLVHTKINLARSR
jgi:hypothetical protein